MTEDKISFSLPDDLGWECNDEIGKWTDDWMTRLAILYVNQSPRHRRAIWEVARAELMDNIYTIIKKYQKRKK